MEFQTINTQEEYQARFNADIGDRLRKNEEKWAKKYEGYLSPDEVTKQTSELTEQITTLTGQLEEATKKATAFDETLAEKDAKIKDLELSTMKHKVAHEAGLSYDAIGFLSGSDEESLKASAEALKTLVGTSRPTPTFSNEPKVETDTKKSAYKSMLNDLKLGGN